ncbi:hypothetical protein [Shewanella surugensis]|uniref:Uncharacterized protein n=1 Tax=Shewanella surugensis TaxID=212020 RepID=A0ABT0LC51_9GAMM|nr:hypothetical protein [Shewanella surugensis]MCL1125284.1 hypothetical protein [Shewanella surugensis]
MLAFCHHLILLIILTSSLAYANPNRNLPYIQPKTNVNWTEMEYLFTDLILQGEWISEISARQNISDNMAETGLISVGVSCSSKDGKVDCFCAADSVLQAY